MTRFTVYSPLKSILIPVMSFTSKDQIKVIVNVLTHHLFAKSYSGEIELFTYELKMLKYTNHILNPSVIGAL